MVREFGELPAVRPLLFASLLLGIFAGGYLDTGSDTDSGSDLIKLAVYDGSYVEN